MKRKMEQNKVFSLIASSGSAPLLVYDLIVIQTYSCRSILMHFYIAYIFKSSLFYLPEQTLKIFNISKA